MTSTSPPSESSVVFVNTSIRVPVDLRIAFERAVKRDDPEDDVSKALRRYMRQRVEEVQEREAA